MLDINEIMVGLVVDIISDVINIYDSDVEDAPNIGKIKANKYIKKIAKIDKKVELQGNRDVYIVLMRQIVLYYTIIAQNFGFKQYMQKISLFSKYLYKKSFFPGYREPLPITYKLWSLLFYMPVMLQGILSYALIVIQNKKHS